ncbi:hypothetical protein SEA_DIANE_46 [Streptomyces phage Diane]|uniref:Uncharacterized protein n=1 Tax=Streptomyces phage Diane TaxID=2041207 RepID=A0A291LHG3_9CAUD|nr:hypothetical protein KGG78_gp46 [Streptomyces phage Diane]ATI18830.1 hypothetical protein SEA_DIANE_46 [Streptomyces phage Diane]
MSEEAPEQPIESEPEPVIEPEPEAPVVEPAPVPDEPVLVEPVNDPIPPNKGEYFDEVNLRYYWRNPDDGLAYSRPYTEAELAAREKRIALDGLRIQAEAAIPYLDERIDASLTYLANSAPTAEQAAAQIKVLCDLAAYSAGTLKRIIVVLGELTGRPV